MSTPDRKFNRKSTARSIALSLCFLLSLVGRELGEEQHPPILAISERTTSSFEALFTLEEAKEDNALSRPPQAMGCDEAWLSTGQRGKPCPYVRGAPCCWNATRQVCTECIVSVPPAVEYADADHVSNQPCAQAQTGKSRVAVMSLSRPEPEVLRHLAKLQLPSTAAVFDLHRRHVLDVLRDQGWEVDYFLCFDKLTPEIVREQNITEAWAFKAKHQYDRIQSCLRRVHAREERCGGVRYSLFFRLRETFLALTDVPDLSKALPNPGAPEGCVMVRFRGTMGLSGVTNDMHSISPCSGCVGEGIRAQVGLMLDDMVQAAPRHLLNFYQLGMPSGVAAVRYPSWFQHGSYDEGLLAKRVESIIEASGSQGCDFFNGPPTTICGSGQPVDEQLRKLPHLPFLGAEMTLCFQAMLRRAETAARPLVDRVADPFKQIISAPVRWVEAATEVASCDGVDPYCGVGRGYREVGSLPDSPMGFGPPVNSDLPADGWVKHLGPDGREFWHHLSLGPPPWDGPSLAALPDRPVSINGCVAGTEEDSVLRVPSKERLKEGTQIFNLDLNKGQEANGTSSQQAAAARAVSSQGLAEVAAGRVVTSQGLPGVQEVPQRVVAIRATSSHGLPEAAATRAVSSHGLPSAQEVPPPTPGSQPRVMRAGSRLEATTGSIGLSQGLARAVAGEDAFG
eukprot:s32_g1.t2